MLFQVRSPRSGEWRTVTPPGDSLQLPVGYGWEYDSRDGWDYGVSQAEYRPNELAQYRRREKFFYQYIEQLDITVVVGDPKAVLAIFRGKPPVDVDPT